MSDFNFEDLNKQIEQDFADASNPEALEALKIKYLGRKGVLAGLTARISTLPPQDKPQFGREVNRIKQKVSRLLEEKQQGLRDVSSRLGAIKKHAKDIDITAPGIAQELGHRHLITQVIDEICDIFIRLGFAVVEGPEVETEYNNFTALNIPLEHPSRDVFDTFYLQPQVTSQKSQAVGSGRLLLRSHTSPVQIRAMKSHKPPLAIIVPGRVYRPDAVDASHSFMFHQVEGFMVDTDITFSDLKGTLGFFIKSIFGDKIKMRFRPHFFPFTEPSAEVDISCIICGGKGCSVCGRKGWLEILGSGMIHPNVFKHVGYDAKKYTGFAFGMGVERIAMLKCGIDDIRLFFQNDLRFLRQF
ncbi:MAG: phenylalanine--tRNA ligase subunit alpha [Candidatus Omnitrophota bacterium]